MRSSIAGVGLFALCSSGCGGWEAAQVLPGAFDMPSSSALDMTSSPPDATDLASSPLANDAGPALTYTQLFAQFFAPGTPGHCATAGCHADPDHNVWLCGTTKDSCYPGMVGVGLIDVAHPEHSMIADPTLSPLTWIDPAGGNMPFDAPGQNAAGRAAILNWVAAGAQNN
jgi:hypothetical protein